MGMKKNKKNTARVTRSMGPIQNLHGAHTKLTQVFEAQHKFFLYRQNTVYGHAKTATLRVYGQLETGSLTQTLRL